MRVKSLVAVAVAAAFALPLSTYGQDKPSAGGTAPSAGTMDKDKDGSISKDEAKGTPLEKDFAKLDKDGDGKLSKSEQEAAKSAGAGAGSPPPASPSPKK